MALPALAAAEPERPYAVTESREPCAHYDPLRQPLYGDLHVHTTYSQDASTQGTRNRPRDAYRFARGEALGIQPHDDEGVPLRRLQLDRPLDFSAVTDHAELLGETEICRSPDLPGHGSLTCRLYRNAPRLAFFWMNWHSTRGKPDRLGLCGKGGAGCLEAARVPWREIQAAAEEAYDRSAACRFTSFVAFEWTAARNTNNLHRNVVFRNERVSELPPSFYEAHTAPALWEALRRGCTERGDGCEVVVIPHNSNLSGGLMFQIQRDDGGAMDAALAGTSADLERVIEVMQHKGDSECSMADSEDELCDFEELPYQNFMGKFFSPLAEPPDPRSFVRWGLLEGLRREARLGVNPFRYGLIASTDTHLATPGYVSEQRHPGHGGAGAPAGNDLPTGLPDDLAFNPGGLAAVWAEENTRDSIFAALQRREAFGTSGPRIPVRLFGGWSYTPDLCASSSFVETGYALGVPMGGTLPTPPPGATAPLFAVSALRDPDGRVPLQRIQIVKGWVDGDASREAVFDVAGNGSNGASVDLDTCRPRGQGADALCAVWRDPDFDPRQRAFYYARVVENPTCRWSQYLCNERGVDCSDAGSVPGDLEACCAPDHRRTIQERAWSSPIWYAPPGS